MVLALCGGVEFPHVGIRRFLHPLLGLPVREIHRTKDVSDVLAARGGKPISLLVIEEFRVALVH